MGDVKILNMNFLEKAFTGENQFWRYTIVFSVIVTGVFLFSLPQSMAISSKIELGEVDSSKLGDLTYLMGLFDSNINLIYMILPFVGGLLFLLLAVKFVHQRSIVSLTTGRERIDVKRIVFSFLLWSVVVVFFVCVQYLIMPESLLFNFQLKDFLLLLVLGVVLIPLQTSFEEYMFRGYLMQSLGVLSRNRWFPLLFTSVLFGVMHISNPEVAKLGYSLLIYYISTGFFLGIITLMDDGIELSLGFHAANNLISALLVTSDWQVFQTYSLFKDISEPNLMLVIIPPLFLFPIVVFIYAKKYGWIDWRQKLTGVIKEQNK